MILKALIYFRQGNEDHARIEIREALDLALTGMFVRVFIDEGPEIVHLVQQVEKQGFGSILTGQILAGAGLHKKTPIHSDDMAALIEPLSERELQVLQLIAEGLTNPEIASRLFLSLYTIKAHASNIYGKLDVHNRTQAVTRARALGVLPST